MTKLAYLDALEHALSFITDGERRDILLELESHIDDTLAARVDLDEEEVVSRLPSPESVAAQYREESDIDMGEAPRGRPEDKKYADGDRFDGHDRSHRFPFGNPDDFFRYARGEPGTIDGGMEAVNRLVIMSVSADIELKEGNAPRYTLRGWWKNGEEPHIIATGDQLVLDLGRHCDHASITVPGMLDELRVSSVSGDIRGYIPGSARSTLKTTSGDVACEGGDVLSVISVSGDVALGGQYEEASIRTASGDITVTAADAPLNVHSSSGDIDIRVIGASPQTNASTASGDVTVRLPSADPAPSMILETLMGNVSTGKLDGVQRDRQTPGRKRWRVEGGSGLMRVKTITGDIAVGTSQVTG